MPLYDYRCERCDAQFEVRQSFSDDTLTACPPEGGPAACRAPGEGPVKKVFTGVGISFKGDGFYKNDFGANANGRRKEREAKPSSDSSDSADSSKSAEGKSSKSTECKSSKSAAEGSGSSRSADKAAAPS